MNLDTVDPLDDRFAATTNDGELTLPGDANHLPAGFTQFSSPNNDDGPAAGAEVDLSGTSFVLAESVLEDDLAYFCTTSDGGTPTGDVTVSNDLDSFTLTALNDTGDATTRTVADCDHLSDLEADLDEDAAWPLTYVGP